LQEHIVAENKQTNKQMRMIGNNNYKHIILVRSEVFTAVTMKNVVFWDIKPQFVLHRRHITSPLQSPAG
jgi:hypothetical protein